MEEYIKIESHKDSAGKDCLKVSLTVDGAEMIQGGVTKISDLWDNEPDKDGKKRLFSTRSGEINSKVFIPQENRMAYINVFKTQTVDPIAEWRTNPKSEILYYPHEHNQRYLDEVTAKLAANHWAVYSDEKLTKAALNTNERHLTLKKVNERVIEAYQLLNYDKYKQDDKYEDMLKSVSKEVEKEMDYCIEKMSVLKTICGNDFYQDITVSKLYKNYRGVIEDKQEKMKVKVVEGDQTSFTFDYAPLEWKDVNIFQSSKEEAIKIIKQSALAQLAASGLEETFDESKLIFTEIKPASEYGQHRSSTTGDNAEEEHEAEPEKEAEKAPSTSDSEREAVGPNS